jgi:hypothetical protein
MSDSHDIAGKTVATWVNPYAFGFADRTLSAGTFLGEFQSKNEALQVALDRQGAEVLSQDGDHFSLYALEGATGEFTRRHIEQTEGYPVSNVMASESGIEGVTLITADHFELVPPSIHKNPYSGDHYRFSGPARLSSLQFLPDEEYLVRLERNTTPEISSYDLKANQVREVLRPMLEILDLYDPRAADWVRGLANDDFVLMDTDELIMACPKFFVGAEVMIVNDLVIADGFWSYSDIEKASFIYHEYVHSRQNLLWTTFEWWKVCVQGGILYENAAEDEAYSGQYKMLHHFGIDSGEVARDVRFYLKTRGLL